MTEERKENGSSDESEDDKDVDLFQVSSGDEYMNDTMADQTYTVDYTYVDKTLADGED